MAQTQHNYNEIMFGVNGEPMRTKKVTIKEFAAAPLAAGTVLCPGSDYKYVPPVDYTTNPDGWVVLLETVDATAGDIASKVVGISGGVWKDKLALVGTVAAYADRVRMMLQKSGIYVQIGTNANAIAGE
jgi:hypothetical protein